MRGFLVGALSLIALQTVIGTAQGPDRAAGLIGSITNMVAAFIDPGRPAIPDRSTSPVASSSSTSSAPRQPPAYIAALPTQGSRTFVT